MKRWRDQPYEARLVIIAVAALGIVIVCAAGLLFTGDFSAKTRWTVAFFIAVALFLVTFMLHDEAVQPLRTLSNLVAALREEDYSLRAREPRRDDALSDIFAEVNELAAVLESRKLEAVEAAALMRAVVAEIDSAILAFDGASRLQLINRAGERLLGTTAERAIGRTAQELGIAQLARGDAAEILDAAFGPKSGRWSIRRSTFREKGLPHTLVVVADITRALREEELQAWQRIVRVLSHELNNTLAPIKSIAASVERAVAQRELADDWRDDVTNGMRVIGDRVEALARFTRAYAQLARMPPPNKRAVDVGQLAARIAALETRTPIGLDGPPLRVDGDPDLLEQLLINVVANAVDAGPPVTLRWRAEHAWAVIAVEDEGPGIDGTANLFVPFFTTKPQGNGIGLVLSRQIAEAHGGTLTLENREGGGAVATLRLPR